jgi:hypothetical protein
MRYGIIVMNENRMGYGGRSSYFKFLAFFLRDCVHLKLQSG